ncbi:MAG: hypothetical protein ACREMZ_02020 [Gemmatimonadales bacterium]
MQSFFDWFQDNVRPDEPWLLLGKGPSFALRKELDLDRYRTLSLNHAVREQPVLVAHVIDVDVIQACGDALEANAGVLVMPWYPHVGNEVGTRTLAEYTGRMPALGRLDAAGRLLWYDLSTSPVRYGSAPVVEATYFSAEAALNLLATAGVRTVRTLGIDGGSSYSVAFDDLRDSTLLANGRTSFDLQFAGFARTILRTGVDFAPLDLSTPVRVYVAHAPAERLPLAVLHHSIRRRASMTVELVPLIEGTGDAVPEGQAVLLTPRAQVLADLRQLWRTAVGKQELLVPDKPVSGSGLALAGEGLGSAIPLLASLIRERAPLAALAEAAGGKVRTALPADWNPAWRGRPDQEALVLDYPPGGSEPWLSRAHPLGHVWARDLLDAVARGYVSTQLVAEEVQRGHVRPSLLYQVEHGVEEPLLLPRRARLLDRDFHPAAGAPSGQSSLRNWVAVLRALSRRIQRHLRTLRRRADIRSRSGAANPKMMIRP